MQIKLSYSTYYENAYERIVSIITDNLTESQKKKMLRETDIDSLLLTKYDRDNISHGQLQQIMNELFFSFSEECNISIDDLKRFSFDDKSKAYSQTMTFRKRIGLRNAIEECFSIEINISKHFANKDLFLNGNRLEIKIRHYLLNWKNLDNNFLTEISAFRFYIQTNSLKLKDIKKIFFECQQLPSKSQQENFLLLQEINSKTKEIKRIQQELEMTQKELEELQVIYDSS